MRGGEDGSTIGVNWRMRLRCMWAGVCLALVITACGGGRLSLSEYNVQGTALVTVMEERMYTIFVTISS